MGHVKIFFRKKPFVKSNKKQGLASETDILTLQPEKMLLQDPRPSIKKERDKNIVEEKTFLKRDNLFFVPANYTNQEVYQNYFGEETIKFLSGPDYGQLYLAYGQTGSGKTHTVIGNHSELGIFPIYLKELLKAKVVSDIKLSCFEIYNEQVRDLIQPTLNLKSWCSLLNYANSYQITSLETLKKYLSIIAKNKMMGNTKLNNNSSRSHTIYKIDINQKCLIFIDLAGNERGKVSNANNKKLFQEANNINLSLFSLKECIRAIREKHKHIPFRTSKLTVILQEIFEKGFHINFIATLNGSSYYYHDTLDTIRYAISLSYSELKQIEVSVPNKEIVPQKGLVARQKQDNKVKLTKMDPIHTPIHKSPLHKPSIHKPPIHKPPIHKLLGHKNIPSPTPLKKEIVKQPEQSNKNLVLDPINNSKADSLKLQGFQEQYFKFIMEFQNLLRQDQRLFRKGNLENISEKDLSREALELIIKKRDYLKASIDNFCQYAEITLDQKPKPVLSHTR